jgi:hypothetical protein
MSFHDEAGESARPLVIIMTSCRLASLGWAMFEMRTRLPLSGVNRVRVWDPQDPHRLLSASHLHARPAHLAASSKPKRPAGA